MALTKRSDSNIIYLEVKHYCLWRGLKKEVTGCDVVEANNPATGSKVKKFGYIFDSISGHATKLVKYDTEQKYPKRYFGFKLHMVDGAETYVLDMPYSSQILRRFLRLARNIDWDLPLTITIFKGKKAPGAGVEGTGVWFQQRGATVKPYYSKEQPHGMPEATFDSVEQTWDFKPQHRWLVDRLQAETVEEIAAAAARLAPPDEMQRRSDQEPEPEHDGELPPHSDYITDDDVPF